MTFVDGGDVLKCLRVDHLDRPVCGVRNKDQSAWLIHVSVVETSLPNVGGKPNFAAQLKAHYEPATSFWHHA